MIKRFFDICASGIGLIALAPFLILIAILIRLDSNGPVFFRQERVGQFGRLFRIHKFRTMVVDAESQGMQITVGADPRVTRVGDFLRRNKLDELPQLIDVLFGDMSLVGPRPEVPHYVAYYSIETKNTVFSVRPGITDNASLEFKDESRILALSDDPHAEYVEKILPLKIAYYVDYVKSHTLLGDMLIILRTIAAILK